jgi:hypothetical protein
MEIIKKHFGLLMGIGLFVIGLFNFSHNTYGYYYDGSFIFLLAVGSILVASGLLKMKKS